MIINDLDGYYIVFDTKNWNTELDTLSKRTNILRKQNKKRNKLWKIEDAIFVIRSRQYANK